MSSPINAAIGKHLRKLRKKHNIRQNALGQIIGLDQSAVSRVENGQQVLTAEQWVKFCTHFKIPDGFSTAVRRSAS